MTVAELLTHGGMAMAPIYLCSFVSLAVFVRKAMQLRAARLDDTSWLPGAVAHVSDGDLSGVKTHCAAVKHPAARVVEAAVAQLVERPERAEPEAERVGNAQLQQLEHQLGLLAFIAQVAPLLGLLGTVLGMVDMFAAMGSSGGVQVDASLLSSGIWKALLTTAAGLIVAVPTLAAHAWLGAQVDEARAVMADALQQILTVATPVASRKGPEDGRISVLKPRTRDAV